METSPLLRVIFFNFKTAFDRGAGLSQIGEHLWEGRYSPKINGKRMARNVYAHTEAECEENLANMIREMKAEIAAEKEWQKQAGLTG